MIVNDSCKRQKMASVQERLKLKRAPIDTWSIREKLCLASSVLRSGDQNWMSVSRSLKAFGDPGRPADWFSQKSCAVQYSNLLENVETPKRKKRTEKGDSVETPSESIARRLTQERIEELKKLMSEDKQIYSKLKEDMTQVKFGLADDRLADMCQEIEDEKRQKERKAEAHERWLKEREEKKIELERAWKPPVAPASPHRRKHHRNINRRNSSQSEPSSEVDSALDSPLSEPLNVDVIGEENVYETPIEQKPSQTPTSPLLTSLLKSPSPAPSVQSSSILHSAITSNRGASPTITSLLNSAPGIPGSSNVTAVVPPTTVSPSLKNLVSSAIGSEQQHHQPPPHNPSPAAGAPTLSMLLELPPSLPGKPLPELPTAAKSTTLPPSTMSAIVSAAVAPSTTVGKVMTVRTVTTATASSPSNKVVTTVPAAAESPEVRATAPEAKVNMGGARAEEVMQVDAEGEVQGNVETKEEPIEVLIEEVVVHDDSVIESELLSSQVADVVVSAEQVEDSKVKEVESIEELKMDGHVIEVCQPSEVTPKDEIKTEDVTDVESLSNNSTSVSAENTEHTNEKTCKEESIESIIETSAQDVVSEIVTEEESTVEVVREAELSSGAVAEVIEITEEQEGTIQTEVVGSCDPLQELEDMEVIILDKMQGLDEVQIVEEMKELECEVVEVVMGPQEKIDEDMKEENEELEQESIKCDDVTAVETLDTEDVVERKDIEETNSSLANDSCAEVVSVVESEKVEEEKKADSEVVEKPTENVTIKRKDSLPSTDDKKGNETELPKESRVERVDKKDYGRPERVTRKDDRITTQAVKELEPKPKGEENKDKDLEKEPIKETTKEEPKKDTKEVIKLDAPKETVRKDSLLKESEKKDILMGEVKKEVKGPNKEEVAPKESNIKESQKEAAKKEPINKEEERRTTKRENIREHLKAETAKEGPSKRDEISRDGGKQDVSSREEKKETVKEKKDLIQKERREIPAKDTGNRSKEEPKVISREALRREVAMKEGVRKGVRGEARKEQVEKQVAKEPPREGIKRESLRRETLSKEPVKEVSKEAKKDQVSKEGNKKVAPSEPEVKKPSPPQDTPKKELPVREASKEGIKRELRRESKEERREMAPRRVVKEERKESPREDLRRRFQAKEVSKAVTRKSEMERRQLEPPKPEPPVKNEKGRRESSDNTPTETRESKRVLGDLLKNKLKNEGNKVKEEEISVKNSKQASGTTTGRSSRTEVDKGNPGDKREVRESGRRNDDSKTREIAEHVEEKVSKRALRAATPSTEDDKTNDAEAPRTVGRKRLATINNADSVPSSPASTIVTDEEKEYRSWKKSIMLLYGRLATHKYASLFLRPITDDQAPGYSSVVHRPIDLLTIKKNIETGVIRTTTEFQRDVMLMFLNSIMYNKSSYFVNKMARVMQKDSIQHIQMLVQVVGDHVPIRRETRTTEANKQRDMLVHPSGAVHTIGSDAHDGDGTPLHKRKRAVADPERGYKRRKADD